MKGGNIKKASVYCDTSHLWKWFNYGNSCCSLIAIALKLTRLRRVLAPPYFLPFPLMPIQAHTKRIPNSYQTYTKVSLYFYCSPLMEMG